MKRRKGEKREKTLKKRNKKHLIIEKLKKCTHTLKYYNYRETGKFIHIKLETQSCLNNLTNTQEIYVTYEVCPGEVQPLLI